MSKINDLNDGDKKVDVTAIVIGKTETREVNTQNGPNNVNNTQISDETGEIKLVTWGEINPILKTGKKIQINSGYITQWNGELQLNVGRYGEIVALSP
ncbi:MAG: hypothetical protein Q7R49_05810 [Candidatus Daviesbacteria bacterium]|nr:hypothetical protein [Candidatus Daviesbacteria bacterium]